MDWTGNEGQIAEASILYTNTSIKVASSLTMQLTSSDNKVTFTCKTSFKPMSTKISITGKPNEALATNVPHYQHLWNFKFNVSCE